MRKINKRRSFYKMIICSLASAAILTMAAPFHAKAVALAADTDKSEIADILQELEKNPDLKEKLLKMLKDQNNAKDSVSDSADSKLFEEQVKEFCIKADQCYKDKDYVGAVKWFRKAAEQGNAIAQCNLGLFYAHGQGVKQDYAEAVKWFYKAAEQGNAIAQFSLGVCYVNGQGARQNYAEAVKWFRKAAEQGNAIAQCNLGLSYANGQGVKQDYAEAAKWFRKAAEQGEANAQRNLGLCYANGKGVKQDYIEAVKWFRKAAEQGNAIAQCNLGSAYANGQGVKQDYVEAARWFHEAAKQGFKPAQKMLEFINEQINKRKEPSYNMPIQPYPYGMDPSNPIEDPWWNIDPYMPMDPIENPLGIDPEFFNNPLFNPEADYQLFLESLESLRKLYPDLDLGPNPSFEEFMKESRNNNSLMGNAGKMDKDKRQAAIARKKSEIKRLEDNLRFWTERAASDRANGETFSQYEKYRLECELKLINARSELDSLLQGE